MKLITPAELRKSKEKTKLDDESLVVCAMETDVKFDGESEDRAIDFTISTETVDSYKDIVSADGWDLDRFLKNPVVLWAHLKSELPVGRAANVRVEGDALKATAEFASKEVYEFADNVYQMLKAGFLNATSVGFIPKEWTWDEERGGFNFIKSELFEFSVVPVPANPDALANAVERGDDLTFLKEWVEETLDLWRPDGHVALWVPRSSVEAVHKAVSVPTVGFVQTTVSDEVGDLKTTTTTTTGDLGVTTVGGTYEPTITSDPYFEFWSPNTFDHGTEDDWKIFTTQPDPVLNAAVEEMRKIIAELAEKVAELTKDPATEQVDLELEEEKEIDDVEEDVIDLSVLLEEEEHQDDIADALKKMLSEDDGDDIDEEEFRAAITAQIENAIMKRTGKLPKEV